jgi:AsmA protein
MPMRRLVLALSGLLAVAAVAVLAVPLLVPADWIRDRIITVVESATGIELTLEGPVSLTVVPSLALEMHDVAINQPGQPTFLTVETVRIGLDLGPLLNGAVVISGFDLIEPRLDLAIDETGQANWQKPDAMGAAQTAPGGGLGFGISHLTVSDGRLSWADARTGSRQEITAVSFETGFKDLAAPLQATGRFTAAGLEQSFDVTLQELAKLLTTGRSKLDLSLSAPEFRLNADGEISAGDIPFSGKVDLSATDLPALLAKLGQAPPPMKSLTAKGDVSVSGGSIDATNLDLVIDGMTGSGAIKIATGGRVPRIDAQLDLAAVNLDDEPMLSESETAGPDFALLSRFDANLDVSIREIRSPALGRSGPIRDLHAVITVENGRATLDLDRMSAEVGTVSGRLTLEPADEAYRIDGRFEAKGLDAAGVLALAEADPAAKGRLSARLGFSASGRSVAELLATLDASGAIRLADGTIEGGPLSSQNGDPSARRLTSVNIEAVFPSLSDQVRVTGTASFADRAMDVDVTMNLQRLIEGGGVPVLAKLQSDRLNVSFEGTVIAADPSANGRIEITAPSLNEALNGTLNRGNRSADGPLRLSGSLEASPRRVRFEDADIVIGRSKLGGTLTLAMTERPRVTARFFGEAADIGLVLAGVAGGDTGTTGWSDVSLNLAPLRDFDADIALDVDQLQIADLTTGPAKVSLTLAAGVLSLDLPAVSLHRGTAAGKATLDASSDRAVIAMDVRLAEVDVLPVLNGVIGLDRIGGTGDLAIDVRSQGQSPLAMAQGLAGTASLSVRDGVLQGIDLTNLMESVARSVTTGFGESGSTAFERLSASFRIQAGIASNDDLRLDSASIRATGAGRIDIPGRAFDYRIIPVLAPTPGSGGEAVAFEVPVIVKGPWNAPRLYPDLEGILSNPKAAYEKLRALGGAFGQFSASDGLGAAVPALSEMIAPAQGDGSDPLQSMVRGMLTDQLNPALGVPVPRARPDEPLGGAEPVASVDIPTTALPENAAAPDQQESAEVQEGPAETAPAALDQLDPGVPVAEPVSSKEVAPETGVPCTPAESEACQGLAAPRSMDDPLGQLIEGVTAPAE